MRSSIYRLPIPTHALARHALRPLRGAAEHALGLRTLARLHAGMPPDLDADHFLARAIDALHLAFDVSAEDLRRVPMHGPVLVVANHPFGAAEGILLAAILRSLRRDVKLVANHLLGRLPELRELLLLVDAFGQHASHNVGPLRRAIHWLRAGHMLGMFPAGAVSHLQRGCVADPPWHPAVARILRHARASVVPVWIEGRNSLPFQLLGMLHPRLRTALLPRELLNKRNRRIRVRIGEPLRAEQLIGLGDDETITSFLRLSTYVLGSAPHTRPARTAPPATPAGPAAVHAAELAALASEQRLVRHETFDVFWAEAAQIPQLLREIGRQRELTFRAVGEGTGAATDLDRFDAHYVHLVLWEREQQAVAGAYRLGPTDRILPVHGVQGLYTRTLFRFDRRFTDRLAPALELGRSFVAAAWQRSPAALRLLWRGIGEYLVRNPRYRWLFGAVSISADYHPVSRQLIVDHLRAHAYDAELGSLVRARRSPRRDALREVDAATAARALPDLESVDRMLERLEPDGAGVPVLLREYSKLGGRIAGFHIDRAFANALDALLVLDLLRTKPRRLERYLGSGISRYLEFHGVPCSPSRPPAGAQAS